MATNGSLTAPQRPGPARRPPRAVAALLLAALAWGAPAVAAAQRRPEAPALDRLEAWRRAMDLHEPGVADPPAVEVAAWPREELDRALAALVYVAAELRKLRGRWQILESRLGPPGRGAPRDIVSWLGLTPTEMARGDATRILKRAAVLHTDIATLVDPRLQAPPREPPVPGPGVSILVNDGRFSSYDTDGVQWDFARRVLDHVPRGPSPDPAVRTWYRAVAAYHVNQSDYGELGRHLDHARTVLRDDAVLAMMAGVRHQAFASARVQASLATIALPPGMVLAVQARERELRAARQAFQEAVTRDPGLVEARVRLGRVLADEGRPAEAAAALRAALAVADEPVLEYLAALFLGEQEAALGRGEDAASAFERASVLYPIAPSPHLGLSHLARARGDQGAAIEALRRALRVAGSRSADDPWWSFAHSAGRGWRTQLDAARRALAAEVSP